MKKGWREQKRERERGGRKGGGRVEEKTKEREREGRKGGGEDRWGGGGGGEARVK